VKTRTKNVKKNKNIICIAIVIFSICKAQKPNMILTNMQQDEKSKTTEITSIIEIRDDDTSVSSSGYISKGFNSKRKKKQTKRELRRKKYENHWVDAGPNMNNSKINKRKTGAEMMGTTLFVYSVCTATVMIGAAPVLVVGAAGAAGVGANRAYKNCKKNRIEKKEFNIAAAQSIAALFGQLT